MPVHIMPAALHVQIILDDDQAYTICWMATKLTQSVFGTGSADEGRVAANRKAAKVIVRRATMNRQATVSNDSLHVESRCNAAVVQRCVNETPMDSPDVDSTLQLSTPGKNARGV